MYAIVNCLQQHDPRLVAWAVAICVIAVTASLHAFHRAAFTHGRQRLAWTTLVAVLLGSGVWATHFMAMLAYHPDLEVRFGFDLTALSYLTAVAGAGAGTAIAVRRRTVQNLSLGGALCGASIAVMHFIGVSAMQLPAEIIWNPALIVLAVSLSIGAAAGATVLAGGEHELVSQVGAVAAMVLAICGLHFVGMAAVTLVPIAGPYVPGAQGGRELALGIGGMAGLILTAGVAMLVSDRVGRTLARLHSALDSAPAAIGAFDAEQRLDFWSEGYATFLHAYGVTARHGLPLSAILESANLNEQPRDLGLRHSPADRQIDTATYDLVAPDGRAYQRRMQCNGDGGFVVVLTDITDRRDLVAREAEARRLAESANAAKSEFLANMSHEIRTPLNGVLGMVQVMARDPLESEQRKRLEVIDDAGHALLALLNNILDLSKIEAGRLENDSYAFDIEAQVRLSTAAHAPLAAQKDVAFGVHIDPEIRGAWIGDGAKLRQVLSNLVSNALKFTAEGSIDVHVRRAANGLTFEVTDTGIGIGSDKIDLIFEKFVQADATTSRRFGGTGLGLAICRQLVEFMGGALVVDSVEGQGSIFRFVLPLTRAVSAPQVAARAEAPAQNADRVLRILAAEDNPTNQLILRALLEPLDVELQIVANGREAVEASAAGTFDLILMDAQMPGMNGLEATAAIRHRELATSGRRVPIIALTANVMRDQIEAYLAAGMDAYVAKPIDATLLFSTMEEMLATPEAA